MQLNRKVRPEILDSVALLVIDAQDVFIDSISDAEGFKKRAAFAIEAARCLKIHTLFTEQAPEKMGHTNSELYKLARNPRVFAKQTFSALGAAGIERFLREKEIYNLLIVGIETPICVYQTGLQATDEDIDVTFLSDCLGARRPQDEAPVLDALRAMGGLVLPSETIFYSLLSDTQNPYFRAFTQIVKAFGADDFNLETYLENRPAEVDETPERPQKQQRKERTTRNQDEETNSENKRKERRPERRDDRRSDRRDDNGDGDSEERQNRKRGRRRGRGRGRDRNEGDAENSGDKQQDDNRQQKSERSDRPERPDRPSKPPQHRQESDSHKDSKPEAKTPAPEPKLESKEKPAKKEKPATEAAIEKATAKKAAKKAVKKAAKKVAKKAAKKAAKKIAKKVAKKPEAE